ncbi:hypothetical protein PTMSG1_08612 [Pyrenophora teres f. maculata]|nr:hypothetical protein PTMSG1_08612 [Pyrenophora teres f. maculata]
MANNIEDDAYIADLLKQDAKKAAKKYELVGIDAFNPRRMNSRAPKPNKNFLRHIIRQTDSHNAALLAKEAEESRARLQKMNRERNGEGKSGQDEGRLTPVPAHDDSRETHSSKRRHHRDDVEKKILLLERSAGDRDHLTIERIGMKKRTKKVEGLERVNMKSAKTVDTDTDHIREHVRDPNHRHRDLTDTIDDANTGTGVYVREAIQKAQGESGIHTKTPRVPNAELPRQHPTQIPLKPSSGHCHPLMNLQYAPKAATDVRANSDVEDDWGDALEALRDRARWQQQGAERLKAAGFTNDQVKKWEKGDLQNEEDVVWSRKGQAREWDRGKIVDEDGDIKLKADFGRLK